MTGREPRKAEAPEVDYLKKVHRSRKHLTIAAALLVIETIFVKKKATTFDLLEQCFPQKKKKPSDE